MWKQETPRTVIESTPTELNLESILLAICTSRSIKSHFIVEPASIGYLFDWWKGNKHVNSLIICLVNKEQTNRGEGEKIGAQKRNFKCFFLCRQRADWVDRQNDLECHMFHVVDDFTQIQHNLKSGDGNGNEVLMGTHLVTVKWYTLNISAGCNRFGAMKECLAFGVLSFKYLTVFIFW